MNAFRSVSLAAAFILLAAGAGCNSSPRNASSTDSTVNRVAMTLEPSTRDILVGETTTITARCQDTYGRDPRITWTTTGGKLITEQNGRVARVRVDEPGTVTVMAILNVDGREVRRESVEIRVKPLS